MLTNQQIARIIRNRQAQGFSPRAIANMISKEIEKELAMSKQHLCRDCHQPTRTETQELFHKPSVTIHTCDNRTCSLWGVTLTTQQYAALTEAEWDSYRQSVANLKKSLEKLGGQCNYDY
jgi:hypothetical protein